MAQFQLIFNQHPGRTGGNRLPAVSELCRRDHAMKLAIATNDKQTIPRAHFGESRYFCIVDLGNAQPVTDEYRENPVPAHHTPGKPDRILVLLRDCNALVGRSFGSGVFSRVASERKQVILTSISRIEDVVRAFAKGDLQAFRRLDPAKMKFVPMESAGPRDAP
jgi:predicted Fe-Mo cluster-binding NifX family protein